MQGRKLLQAPCIVAESRHLQFGNELFIKPKQQQTPAAVAYWTQWYDSVPQCSIHQIVADYSMSCTKETSADCSLARGSLAKQQTKSWRKKKATVVIRVLCWAGDLSGVARSHLTWTPAYPQTIMRTKQDWKWKDGRLGIWMTVPEDVNFLLFLWRGNSFERSREIVWVRVDSWRNMPASCLMGARLSCISGEIVSCERRWQMSQLWSGEDKTAHDASRWTSTIIAKSVLVVAIVFP